MTAGDGQVASPHFSDASDVKSAALLNCILNTADAEHVDKKVRRCRARLNRTCFTAVLVCRPDLAHAADCDE
jgi:hypothetical protein